MEARTTFRSTATIGALAAAAAGLVAVATADKSDAQGNPIPVGAAAYDAATASGPHPIGAQWTTLATLSNVTAGAYLVTAKATLSEDPSDANDIAGGDCRVMNGSKQVDYGSQTSGEGSGQGLTTVTLHGPSRLRGTVAYQCRTGTEGWRARDVQLTALRVRSLIPR